MLFRSRENQRKHRLKKKIQKEFQDTHLSNYEQDKRYRRGIVDYFNQFDFDYCLTGTINQNYVNKQFINNFDDSTNQINNLIQNDLTYKTTKKVGIYSIRNYTNNYIEFLFDKNLIDRCFGTVEEGVNNNLHVNILLKFKDGLKNIKNFTENYWLLGTSFTTPITDKKDLLVYVCKELKPSSFQKRELVKIDSWFFKGDFNNPKKVKINTTQSLPPIYRKNKSTRKTKDEIDSITKK